MDDETLIIGQAREVYKDWKSLHNNAFWAKFISEISKRHKDVLSNIASQRDEPFERTISRYQGQLENIKFVLNLPDRIAGEAKKKLEGIEETG